ncbi:MAG TPA: lipopolysaccharide biosynthesis protein [Bryocella sp.]|nr:lipopolysaccharide biosynthesis protein [Bryocella sp.]
MKLDAASSRYGRIGQAVGSGALVRVLASAITLVSLPLAVRYLGAERYGVWATITTTAVWINLLDLGIANTLTNHISRAYALGDKDHAARGLTNALALTGGVAALAGVAAAFLFPRVDWARLLNVSTNISGDEVRSTVAAAVVLMLLALPCNLVSKVLAGYQELHRSNYAACAAAVAGLCGLVLGVALRVSMPVLFVMSAGCLTFANLLLLLIVIAWHKPWLRPRARWIDRSTAQDLLSSGSSFFLIQVAAVVVFSSDNLVVSHYLGAAEVTPYSVTWRLVGFVAVLPSLLFPALWPAYAEAYARRDYGWIRRTFAFTMTGTLALNAACIAGLLLFGRALIRLWAGAAAVPAWPLLAAMCVWALISGCMTVESCLLAALNRTRAQAVLSIIAAAVNLALSIVWVRRAGSLGVIGGTIASYLIVLVVPQTMIVRKLWTKELGREQPETTTRSEGRHQNQSLAGQSTGRVLSSL